MYNCLKLFKWDLWSIMDHISLMAAFPFEVVLWSMTGAMRSVLNGPTKTECACVICKGYKWHIHCYKIENMFRSQCPSLGPILHYNGSDVYFAHRHSFPGKLATITRIKEKLSDSWRYHILNKAVNFDLFCQPEAVEKKDARVWVPFTKAIANSYIWPYFSTEISTKRQLHKPFS